MKKQTVVHIIPTYNEKENITAMLRILDKLAKKDKKRLHKVLVVDDNSPDGTGKIVKMLAQKDKKIYLVTGKKKGLGSAMIRGLRYATSQLKADIVVSNEADFAFDPKHIPYMLEKLDMGFDVVIGSRHIGSGKTEGWTVNRKVNHWVANTLFASWIAGVSEIKDHNGAFRAIRVRGVLDKINLENLNATGFGFFNYFLFRLTQVTSKFHEFPIVYKFRTAGESKVSFNPKYFKTYLRDVSEYITLSMSIRVEKIISRLNSKNQTAASCPD